MTPLVFFPLLAFALSLLLHIGALRYFPGWELLDFPERYGLARPRIPYPVGIVSVLLFVLFFAVLGTWDAKTLTTITAILLLAAFSFVDDRRPLPARLRLLVQAAVALIIFLGGARIFSFTNPLEGIVGGPVLLLDFPMLPLPWIGPVPLLSALFTLFWLGLTVNALNWFDGIPGQVSALSVIGFLAIGFLSLSQRVNQPSLALFAFILAGIWLGCLMFDVPGGRLLIGDTGAMFAGLMLGVLTIYSGGKVATAFLVLGVPLFDVLLVIGQRIVKHRNIFHGNASDEHLHHRLLQRGWSRGQIIALTAGMGAGFGVTALFLNTTGKFVATLVLFLLMLGLFLYSQPRRVALRDTNPVSNP